MNRNRLAWFGALLALLVVNRAFSAEPMLLSLQDAQNQALKNHPRITEADLLALASQQAVRETRSGYFPTITADATAAGVTEANTRIAAGGLNNPLILDREADGVSINQVITDFGRTINLTASSKLRARAQEQSALATREEILLEVNAAFYAGLQAQSVLAVANQTVDTRQLTYDQVSELATNQLRSGLDATFARLDLDEGRLLLADAQNDLDSAFVRLANILGDRATRAYRLVDETNTPGPVAEDELLLRTALQNRPDLLQLRYARDAADRFARAEKDLNYPTISAVGTAGVIPVHDPLLKANYAAAGVNFSLPIFDGFLFSARKQEADLQAGAAAAKLEDAENNVIRDVRVAALKVSLAAKRETLTTQALASASQAFDLANALYRAGSTSIVALSQAQLGKTKAEIDAASARYDFLLQNAVLNFQTGQLR